jgi:hypothetical protein
MIFASVRGEFQRDEVFMRCAMEALTQLLKGALEATIPEEGL